MEWFPVSDAKANPPKRNKDGLLSMTARDFPEVHASTGQTKLSLNEPLLLTFPGQAQFVAQLLLPLFRQSCFAR